MILSVTIQGLLRHVRGIQRHQPTYHKSQSLDAVQLWVGQGFFVSRLTAQAVDRRTPDPIPALAMFVWRACATIATMALLKVAEAAGNLAKLFDTSSCLTWDLINDHGFFGEVPEGHWAPPYCHGRWHDRCIVVCKFRCLKLTAIQLSSCSVTNCPLAFCVFYGLLTTRVTMSEETAALIATMGTLHAMDRLMQGPNFCDLARFEAKTKLTYTDSQACIQKSSKNWRLHSHTISKDQPRQFGSSHLDDIWRESDEMMCDQLTFADKTKRDLQDGISIYQLFLYVHVGWWAHVFFTHG